MIRFNDILTQVQTTDPTADLDLLKKAYIFSAKVHAGQLRQSGEPYLGHPLEVAYILAKLRLDTETVCAGLLHDTVEDSLVTTLDEIGNHFGDEIAMLVDGVTKIGKMTYASAEQRQAENFKKILIATAKDMRIVLIKLADRLHNMRTLEHMPRKKQHVIAQETLDIYAPLANRLGIQWIKNELEDLAFRHLNPAAYYQIILKLSKGRQEREKFVEEVIQLLKNLLESHNIFAEVKGRLKNVYSIWRKMQVQHLEFEQVMDLTAFRILVNSVAECYEVMGIIHNLWKPVPGRFKDYIALPKANMYQSLHTTVIGPGGERVEIQIRTIEMHLVAEYGIAAHWKYKEGGKFVYDRDSEKFAWLRRMLEYQQEVSDPKEYLDIVKVDLFSDEVYVFTPLGDVINLPAGSTPVDFAYRIHTGVGDQCIGAKINGVIVPLKTKLKSGDRIEILTRKGSHPNRDWLDFVVTSNAKAKIRDYLKKQERESSIALGKEMLEKALRRDKISLAKLEKSGKLNEVAEKLSYNSEGFLLASIGYGKLSVATVVEEITGEKETADEAKESSLERILRPLSRKEKGGIRIGSVDDVMFRMAKCCNPLPGEPIVGFVTRGRGITVHASDCPAVLEMDNERRVEVEWDNNVQGVTALSKIIIYSQDQPGVLANISKAISMEEVNIAEIHSATDKSTLEAQMTFSLQIKNLEQLQKVMKAIEKVKGVIRIERLRR